MSRTIILIGGGGHCSSCIEAIESAGSWAIAGIVDTRERVGEQMLGYEIIGSDDDLPFLADQFGNALITIGQIQSSSARFRLYKAAQMAGFSFPTVIAKSAVVSRHSKLGPGTIVLHHVLVNAGAAIGNNCIINSGAIVEHDATIAENTHISTGAIVNGGCRVGSGCFIGSGSVLRNGIEIGNDIVVGAGTTVVSDLSEPGTYVGCPARKLK